MKSKFLLAGAVASTFAFGMGHAFAAGTPVKVCDDDAGWPPFTFADPKDPKKITGAATEVIVEALKKAGYEPQITLLPWKRCLAEVESGETAMLMNAAYSDERKQKYLLTKPYYTLSSGLFYMASKFPKKPDLKAEDLKKHKYCGLAGYNYKMYPDIPESTIDMGAKDEVQRFKKLRDGQCDFAIGDIEVLKGFAAMGKLDLKGIDSVSIPGAKPKEFHAMVTRGASGGEKLLKVLDDGIDKMKADKSYAKIFKKFGI